MEVFHFGAGSIGRGFIGKILSENSYNVTFIDVNEEIISQLNKDNEYTVETVGANSKTETVKNVCGLLSGDLEGIKRKVPETDLITTAVGANVLEIIAPTVAEIIKFRKKSNQRLFAPVWQLLGLLASQCLMQIIIEIWGKCEPQKRQKRKMI